MKTLRSRQSGAALIVAMILLLVITIIAVSAMGTSRLELRMAGDQQFSLIAFQAAQSAIESRIVEGGFSTTMSTTPDTYPFTDMSANAETVVRYETASEVPGGGYSLGSGFQAYHFEIDASATGPRDAMSEQIQGFYIVGPGGS